MQNSRQVLNVFLASPSDVAEERATAQDVVSAINSAVGRELGWLIDLYIWENTAPGYGRPQELINPMVDACRLFIGLLWERWGQPTGTHGSGFEEEFERARSRHKKDGQPEIWLVFKTVDSDKLKDPGPQLTKVLDFKKAQAELREALFKEVRDLEDWKAKLHSWLLTYVVKLASLALLPPQSALPTPELDSRAASDLELSLAGGSTQKIPQQLVELPSLLGRVINSGQLEFSPADATLLDEFSVVRLFLLSSTWMSRRNTGDVLGTHEANLLYKHRERLQATTSEYSQLIRTVVGDSSDVVPGWFWFKRLPAQIIQHVLLSLATQDSSDAVRAKALQLLRQARIRLPSHAWDSLPFNAESSQVRNETYKYLGSVGDENALDMIERLYAEHRDDLDLLRARLTALARLHPARAASEIIADVEHTTSDELRILRQSVSQAPDNVIFKGLETSPSEKVRKTCLRELQRRNKVPLEIARKLASDTSLAIRALALECLAMAGALDDVESVRQSLKEEEDSSGTQKMVMLSVLAGRPPIEPSADSIILKFYGTQPTEKILQAVDWFTINGALAYRVLAVDRYEQVSSTIRADLKDGFRRIKQQSYAKRESEYGEKSAQRFLLAFEEFEDSIRSSFAESALFGLARNGQPADVAIARPYLSSTRTSLRDAAVEVISRFGTSDDVNKLLEIATESWGDIRKKAASAALKFASAPLDIAFALMNSRSSEVASIGFEWLFSQQSSEVKRLFTSLLRDGSDTDRTRAVYYFLKWLTHRELEDLLAAYIAEETYYYNVVTWFDRLLYSPSPLREMFETLLKSQATGTPKA